MRKFFAQFSDLRHFLNFLALLPFWLLSNPGKRKPLSLLISGLLPHRHVFSDEVCKIYVTSESVMYFKACKHHGCNVVTVESYLTQKGIDFNRRIFKQFPKYYNDNFRKLYKNAYVCDPATIT